MQANELETKVKAEQLALEAKREEQAREENSKLINREENSKKELQVCWCGGHVCITADDNAFLMDESVCDIWWKP